MAIALAASAETVVNISGVGAQKFTVSLQVANGAYSKCLAKNLEISGLFTVRGDGSIKVRRAVAQLQQECPEMLVEGEMQIGFALNKELRDELYPFNKLKGKDVNTLIFPNLTSARSSYKMLQALNSDVEIIGPIQMGLNKPIHFTDFASSVRDVVNITAVAVIDAYVDKIKSRREAAKAE